MRKSPFVAFAFAAAAVLGGGCGSSQDPRVGELEKRVEALERELAQVRSSSGAPVAKTGAPVPIAHASWKGVAVDAASGKGLAWLVSVQGKDGGWSQDGGKEGDARQDVNVETQGNDVANTSLVCLALLRAGTTPKEGAHRDALLRGIGFILSHVEEAPAEGLAVTKRTGTQIQGKLGPFIDTFLGTMVLSQVDGQVADSALEKRVRGALEKCVAKLGKNQKADGSFNVGQGWAPVIGTSIASRGLYQAREKGVAVPATSLERLDRYTKDNWDEEKKVFKSGEAGAGVELYQAAQALENSSRTAGARAENKSLIDGATAKLSVEGFVGGFGSMGGEEFVSYMNISDSLVRTGGEPWAKWNGKIKGHLAKLQNQDGTWAGHHCITGRVACTAAAVMTLLSERSAVRIE